MTPFDDILEGYGTDLRTALIKMLEARRARLPRDFNKDDAWEMLRDAGIDAFFVEDKLRDLLREGVGLRGSMDARTSKIASGILRDWSVELVGVADELQSNLTDLVKRIVREPHNFSQITSEVERITGAFRGRATTIATTSLSQAQRAFVVESAKNLPTQGEPFFGYDGPNLNTRPFCASLVGKAFTKKQISRLDNGQGLDVLTSCGGWNCRHSWTPLPDEAAAEIAGYQIATDADIARANAVA